MKKKKKPEKRKNPGLIMMNGAWTHIRSDTSAVIH